MFTAGPFTTRGSYRLRAVLYDGFQPVAAGPNLVVGASSARRGLTPREGTTVAVFNETLTLRGLALTPTMLLVSVVGLGGGAVGAVGALPSCAQSCADVGVEVGKLWLLGACWQVAEPAAACMNIAVLSFVYLCWYWFVCMCVPGV